MSKAPSPRTNLDSAPSPASAKQVRWRYKWSIDIYTGLTPLALEPASGARHPALTAGDVTDISGCSVADPFLLLEGGHWYLFFEVWNGDTDRGEVAFATSEDGLNWNYGAVVLREPFHLSYPQVFAWDGELYMIPETRQSESVRLYRATAWPGGWQCIRTLLHGPYADATILRYQSRWWLFAQRGLDECRLFSSDELEGNWREHPASPLWPGNRRRTRPGGRIISWDGRLLRFAQDGLPHYGSCLRAFEIDHLNEAAYGERELPESPILRASRSGWNAMAMHHIDAVPMQSGGWLAAVDGANLSLY